MTTNISIEGAANKSLTVNAHENWQDIAAEAGVNLEGFDADVPLPERIAWALRTGARVNPEAANPIRPALDFFRKSRRLLLSR